MYAKNWAKYYIDLGAESMYVDLSGESDAPVPHWDDLNLVEAAYRARQRILHAFHQDLRPDTADKEVVLTAAKRSMVHSAGGTKLHGDQLYVLWFEDRDSSFVKVGRSYDFEGTGATDTSARRTGTRRP
ncbi:hypothetical protein [Streptomyces sp. NBC_01264]|uniref:hypothetical protein n=1 Tax=Streptomyces sp. NBC_01264 TaxID=2903804 RepID=UPI00225B0A67|nr:hypothetical protein [Streptomyces sp. NBC_01264]MCX4776801.1 hypothetical protein [Streptomyces sp. NBC_01264]